MIFAICSWSASYFSIRFAKLTWWVSDLQSFHDQHQICKSFMMSIIFAKFSWSASSLQNFHDEHQICTIFLDQHKICKGHSLHHMLRWSSEGVVCANNGHLIRRYYQAAHFCQTNSRLFLHWKTFRTSSNQPSFAAEIFLGAHHDNIIFVNKQDYFLK